MDRLFHIEDILAYIEEQKKGNASPTRELSMYYEATQKNLETNGKTYSLWEGYIETLKKNGYAHSEIREVYKMLKSKFWRFFRFWQGWFNYESRLPIEQSKRAKVLELANDILQYKECLEKEKIMQWIQEKSAGLRKENNTTKSIYVYPETPKSHIYTNTLNSSFETESQKTAQDGDIFSVKREDISNYMQAESSQTEEIEGYSSRIHNLNPNNMSPFRPQQSAYEHTSAYNLNRMDMTSNQLNSGKDSEYLQGTQQNSSIRYINRNSKADIGQIHSQNGLPRYSPNNDENSTKSNRDRNAGYGHTREQVYRRGSSFIRKESEIELSRSDSMAVSRGYSSMEMPTEHQYAPMYAYNEEVGYVGEGEQKENPKIHEEAETYAERSSEYCRDPVQYYEMPQRERIVTDKEEPLGIEHSQRRAEGFQGGQITSTGDVFDITIGKEVGGGQGMYTAVKEKKAPPEETAVSDKYFNLTAPKKITLNGKRLRILRTIGKGGSAKVYQVLSDKNEVFALKKIKLPQETEDSEIYKSYVNEISILKRLRNRHEIVTLKDSYVNRDRIAILMEYGDIDLCRFLEIEKTRFPGGYRKSNENYTMISLWEQMLRAVKCIHEHRIVHRDLKPGNFLFVNGRLKLIDFGISKEIRNDTTNIIREKQIGTINYMSPEAIIEGKTKMGRNSDIWSLGCILYEMYFGESPFMRFKNLVQRMQKLLDPEYAVEIPEEEADDNRYKDIAGEIKKCLIREPKERAKIDALLRNGICGKVEKRECLPSEERSAFTKSELKAFISKIMDLRHTSTTEEGHEKIIDKITNLYFEDPSRG